MGCGFFRTVGVAGAWFVLAFAAFAQAPESSTRFRISGYSVDGSPRLKLDDFLRIVTPFIGPQKSVADVLKARDAVQKAYLDVGHCSVQVTVPKTEPDAGIITFRLLQSAVPLSRDCTPMAALDEKRGSQPAPVAPGGVAVRPLSGMPATTPESTPPVAPQSQAARAPLRPLQDRPLAAASVAEPVKPTAAMPEPASSPRIAQTTPNMGALPEPKPKPAPVVVQSAPTSERGPAEKSAVAGPLTFDINRFVVENNTVLKADTINKVLRGYAGKGKNFADVQRALEALQAAYQRAGYGTVVVMLPEQEIERGDVHFEVIEPRLGKVGVEGNEHYNVSNVRRSVPSLKEGQTANSIAIARSLKVANESPTKQTQVTLKAGSADGVVDATMKVVDDDPKKYSLSFDNSGTDATGRFRLAFGFQHANMFNRDHQLTVQYVTNPENPNKVTVFGAGYHVPLYGRGDSLDIIAGYSDVSSGTLNQLYLVSGAGTVVLGRYNQNLDRIGDYEHKITYGIDYKAFSNKVTTLTGAPLVPDITLHPISVTYSGLWRKDVTDIGFYAGFTYHPFPGGNDDAPSNFKASRGCVNGSDTPAPTCVTGASAEYAIWRYGGTYTRLLPKEWSVRVALSGQLTNNALVAGEQFGLGGANSVRGFNERAYANDKGHQTSFEIYTPDLAPKFGFEGGTRLKLLAFYDTGTLGRNFIQPGEQTGLSVDSIGIGLRLVAREKLTLRLDYAQVKHDGGQDPNQSIRDGRRNSNTVHGAVQWVF